MDYGYCRISTKKQSIERQIRNIKNSYPTASIITEVYTGRKIQGRREFEKLIKNVEMGDKLIFDSVSRMSRDADEGIITYFQLYERGVELVFLKEPYIDSQIYAQNTKDKIELQGTDEDEIFIGLNNYFRKLAEKQIRIAFEQAEKEITDLRQRTKEGLITAKLNGKQVGGIQGVKLTTKKSIECKKKIRKLSRDFEGTNKDTELIKILGITRNTFYKYKRELIEELQM